MSLSYIIFTCIAAFSILSVIAVLFFERKNPASSLVWVLALLFLPVIGFIAYLFLGTGFRINKRKRYQLKAISDDIYNNYIIKHLNLGHTQVYIDNNENSARIVQYLKKQPNGTYTDNNNAEIFVHGTEMFERMIADMQQAKTHIHVLFYIFRTDELGNRILSVLEEKAREGVEVRLLYDSLGTLMASNAQFKKLQDAGGQVIPFAPIFSSLNSHLRLNYRNHRKIVVIDGLTGYVGGMNVGVEYCSHHEKLTPWRDTHLCITGSAVWFLQERFIVDWAYSSSTDPHETASIQTYFPEPANTGNLGMQIISSGPDTIVESPIKSGMLAMIYSAQKRISIQTPYFAPGESVTDALRIAARSNIDVRLMIPRISDYDIVHRATLGYARDMLDAGVKVYLYNGFIHAKTIAIDHAVASIGTTNLTNRSFTLDFEVNAFIYDEAFARRCEEIFETDIATSQQLPQDYFEKQSSLTRATHNFARLLAPMM